MTTSRVGASRSRGQPQSPSARLGGVLDELAAHEQATPCVQLLRQADDAQRCTIEHRTGEAEVDHKDPGRPRTSRPAGSRGASYRIQQNEVLAENPSADGILLAGFDDTGLIDRAVLDGNTVDMRDSDFGGITFFGGVSQSLVTNNIVKGNGLFDERLADVFLDVHTQNTVLTGSGGTVVDLGTGNRITGYGPIGYQQHIGAQIRDAQRDKQETQSPALTGGASPEG